MRRTACLEFGQRSKCECATGSGTAAVQPAIFGGGGEEDEASGSCVTATGRQACTNAGMHQRSARLFTNIVLVSCAAS